jgi:prophage antirepressor-like protein
MKMNDHNLTPSSEAVASADHAPLPIEAFFEGTTVRSVEKDGEFWFVASDIAKALGYRDAEKMTRGIDEDEKGTHIVGTLGGEQEVFVICESGVFDALSRSRKDTAKEFRRWLRKDLLPTLRKEGSYHMALKDVPKRLFTLDEIDELVERHLPQIYTPVELPDYAKGIRTSSYEQRELDREGMRGRLREICGEYMKLRALYPLFEQTVKTACDTDNGCDVTSAESLLYTCMTFINHAKETFFSIPLAPEEIPNETLKVINFESIFANQFGKTWKTYIGEGRRLGGAGAEYGRDNWLTRK